MRKKPVPAPLSAAAEVMKRMLAMPHKPHVEANGRGKQKSGSNKRSKTR